MTRFKKKALWIIGVTFVLLVLVKIWPIPFDNKPLDSLKIYGKYIRGGNVKISEILGVVETAWAIGPYDSFTNSRFSNQISQEQAAAANKVLHMLNKKTFGDNGIVLIGFRGDKVKAFYASNFFKNLNTQSAGEGSPSCVSGNGFISLEKHDHVVVVKLS